MATVGASSRLGLNHLAHGALLLELELEDLVSEELTIALEVARMLPELVYLHG